MKKYFTGVILSIMLPCITSCSGKQIDSLTYAVYPYLPDAGYYQEIIESRWAVVEPDIELIRADWNCYEDGEPEGIDVIMYDAVMRDALIDAGWIQPIGADSVKGSGDIFPFALEGLTREGRLYGIPVFLCGNFLIYDKDCEVLEKADHITDLADQSEILVVNSEDSGNRAQYKIEVAADALGEANPSPENISEDTMRLIDRLAVDTYKRVDDAQVAMAYDEGTGCGYIGFSESIRLLRERSDRTGIKTISFSERENILRLYADAAAVTAGAEGIRYEKCLELINVMAESDVLSAISVMEGAPQYLLLARSTPYQSLSEAFPLYARLEELAANENNHVILTR